jgi:hypothetical protein
MTNISRIAVLVFSLALAPWLASPLPGQSVNARIYGNVQNEEGEYLAGVWVRALNIGNNAETTTFTNAEKGAFRFLGLAPGIYQVSFDMEGYQSNVASGIQLSADQSATLHIKLKHLKESDAVLPVSIPPRPQAPSADLPAGPLKKWQFELSAGTLFGEPAGLNDFIDYDLWLCKSKAYEYANTYGLNIVYTVNNASTGRLKPMDGGRPLTARVRFFLDKTFSLVLGIGTFERQQVSVYSLSHTLVDVQPGSINLNKEYSLVSEFPDYLLGMKGLFPHVGAQAGITLEGGLRAAGFVHAGWLFSEYRYSSTRLFRDGFLNKISSSEVAMNGRGSGLTLEAGARFEVEVWRGLGFFAEGLYQVSRVKKVTGERSASVIVQDAQTLEIEFRSTEKTEGRWLLGDGAVPAPFIPPAEDSAGYDPFTLDLSGLGLRAGLFFRF